MAHKTPARGFLRLAVHIQLIVGFLRHKNTSLRNPVLRRQPAAARLRQPAPGIRTRRPARQTAADLRHRHPRHHRHVQERPGGQGLRPLHQRPRRPPARTPRPRLVRRARAGRTAPTPPTRSTTAATASGKTTLSTGSRSTAEPPEQPLRRLAPPPSGLMRNLSLRSTRHRASSELPSRATSRPSRCAFESFPPPPCQPWPWWRPMRG